MKKLKILYLIFVGLITLFILFIHTFSFFSAVVDAYSMILIGFLFSLIIIPSLKKIRCKEVELDLWEATNEIVDDLKKEFTIDSEDITKLYASPTTSTLALTTADIIKNKRICPSCKKG
ncbi:MAG: hypothetical protein WC330_05480, partial [Candidatus Omnitrophota bacterium]